MLSPLVWLSVLPPEPNKFSVAGFATGSGYCDANGGNDGNSWCAEMDILEANAYATCTFSLSAFFLFSISLAFLFSLSFLVAFSFSFFLFFPPSTLLYLLSPPRPLPSSLHAPLPLPLSHIFTLFLPSFYCSCNHSPVHEQDQRRL
jgi:hypothetical protein